MHSPINNLIFETEKEAEIVTESIGKIMNEYSTVSVADVYDACGLVSTINDHKYGWDESITMTIDEMSKGYILKLENPRRFK